MAGAEHLEAAQVAGVHGVRGAVLLRVFIENMDLFAPGEPLLLQASGAGPREYTLESISPHKGKWLVKLKGVDDRDSAAKLRGALVLMEKKRLPPLEKGQYYWCDLLGLEVFDKDGRPLGVVDSIIETGSNDVFVVKNSEREILAPNLSWVVLSIDLVGGVMVVDLPEGL